MLHAKALAPAAAVLLLLVGWQAAGTDEEQTPMIARGTFEVNLTPEAQEGDQPSPFQRLRLTKSFDGDLQGSSDGHMIGARNAAQTSGGYVAMERFRGTLDGKQGSFMLQHNGTMHDGGFSMNVVVVPGSGSGALSGIDGSMKIIIEGATHSYEFEYRLPQSP